MLIWLSWLRPSLRSESIHLWRIGAFEGYTSSGAKSTLTPPRFFGHSQRSCPQDQISPSAKRKMEQRPDGSVEAILLACSLCSRTHRLSPSASKVWWGEKDSNLRRQRHRFYRPLRLTTPASPRKIRSQTTEVRRQIFLSSVFCLLSSVIL